LLAVFKTPLPNPKIWNSPTIGTLSNPDAFVNGGWWHDSRILAATGEGLDKEEPRAWDGWWNENIVELIRLSMKQTDALCVLLTGRSESGFSDLIKRMVTSKGLEFDLISLKPAVGPNNERFANTMAFKQTFLQALMETYRYSEEIRIYEDRAKHVRGFRDFLDEYNLKKIQGKDSPNSRGPIKHEVIQVADVATYLDPVVEVAEVQQIIKDHNAAVDKGEHNGRGERLAIRKTVFYTSYMISSEDSKRLLTLAQIPNHIPETELKFHANSIMICPRPCPPNILEKIGGLGAKQIWEVTGTACFENTVWAACVKPVPATSQIHTSDNVPLVVLALRKGARHIDAGKIQHWQPVSPDKAIRFETTIGEKVLLRIEAEDAATAETASNNGGSAPFYTRPSNKRKYTGASDDFRSRHNSGPGPAAQHHQHQHKLLPPPTSAPALPGPINAPTGPRAQVANSPNSSGGGRSGGFRGGGNFRNQRNEGGGGGGKRGRGHGGGGRSGGGHHGHHHHHHHHYKSLDDIGTKENNQGGFAHLYEDLQQTPPSGPSGHGQNIPKGPAGWRSGYHQGGNGGGGGGDMNNYY